MSAFLGPVHQWMYKKILLREHLTEELVMMAEKNNWVTGLAAILNQSFGVIENAPLETIIDKNNIHGWLSQRVDMAEQRFARAVEAILSTDADSRLKDMKALFQSLGETHAAVPETDAEGAYKVLDGLMLDGMPCDGGRRMVSQNTEEVVWDYSPTMHPLCQDEKGQAVFQALRISFMNGVLAHTDLVAEPAKNTAFRIRKESADVRH